MEAHNVGKPQRENDRERPAWGAQPYTLFGKRRVADYVDIGGRRGFGVPVPLNHPRPHGWGPVPVSNPSF